MSDKPVSRWLAHVFLIAAFFCALTGAAVAQSTLPGTAPLTDPSDLALSMVDAINQYLARETVHVAGLRERYWKRDYASSDAYDRSIAPNRANLARIIGAVDARVSYRSPSLEATTAAPALVGRGRSYRIYAVRWPVFEGVEAEGLLIEPDRSPVARIVALPDADWTPEALAGLETSVAPLAQFARRFAESGCQVLVPALVDRQNTFSGVPGVRMSNQPHREFIYRMAYETGRHIIGYEVQKVLAGVDWFVRENQKHAVPIAVAGYGEGGLVAFHSAALDTRIDAALVSGHFQPREDLWKEPIYRDVWALLREFGDAEIATMIAPRALVIEASGGPEINGPPPATSERRGAAPHGVIATPPLDAVRREVERARPYFAKLNAAQKLELVPSGSGQGYPGSDQALSALFRTGGIAVNVAKPGAAPEKLRPEFHTPERMRRQVQQLVGWTQYLVRQSPFRRAEFWSKADSSSPERWRETTRFYRDYIWDEVIGRMPSPSVQANPRTRLVYDEPKFRGYEVVLDVWPGVFATGILLVPKDLRPGERRPVVVCQHGLEGRSQKTADPKGGFAARLAEEGFITYAPQNPYIGGDRFRLIQRKGHPLKLALFSFIVGQHQRHLEWLSGLPFVDPRRIGFYGISYGGKTAVRVPPLLDGYALSICSADFNEWVWKNTSIDAPISYVFGGEYDMIEFDFANVVNYGELANLIAPRPFMVERGHGDKVGYDEWVAYEFAKVRRFYSVNMNLPHLAEIEFFNGPHAIHGKGTFAFLKRHLRWPD